MATSWLPRTRTAFNPENWIAQTNEYLPREVQEEAAVMMAEALPSALGNSRL
jgi:hypothetical protein